MAGFCELDDLRTKYSLDDVLIMIDMARVKNENQYRAQEAARQEAAQKRRLRGGR